MLIAASVYTAVSALIVSMSRTSQNSVSKYNGKFLQTVPSNCRHFSTAAPLLQRKWLDFFDKKFWLHFLKLTGYLITILTVPDGIQMAGTTYTGITGMMLSIVCTVQARLVHLLTKPKEMHMVTVTVSSRRHIVTNKIRSNCSGKSRFILIVTDTPPYGNALNINVICNYSY